MQVPRYLHPQLRLATAEAQLPPDPALHAWRAALEAELLLALGQGEQEFEVVGEALTLPRAFRAQLGRVWGQLLVAYGQEALAERWTLKPGSLLLGDALATHFLSLSPAPSRAV